MKYSWTEYDNIICCICYLNKYTIDKTFLLLPHIPYNSIKMKYSNCLYLDKGNIKGSLKNYSKKHKKIWDILTC
jgi:hypothetical protein